MGASCPIDGCDATAPDSHGASIKAVIDHVRNDHPEQYGAYIEERNKLLKELSAIERLKRWWNGDHLDINDIEAREA